MNPTKDAGKGEEREESSSYNFMFFKRVRNKLILQHRLPKLQMYVELSQDHSRCTFEL